MDSGLISKVQKAKRYAREPERVRFTQFTVKVRGDHQIHELSYREGHWHCTCAFFPRRQVCSHSMALEQILAGMLPTPPTAVSR